MIFVHILTQAIQILNGKWISIKNYPSDFMKKLLLLYQGIKKRDTGTIGFVTFYLIALTNHSVKVGLNHEKCDSNLIEFLTAEKKRTKLHWLV